MSTPTTIPPPPPDPDDGEIPDTDPAPATLAPATGAADRVARERVTLPDCPHPHPAGTPERDEQAMMSNAKDRELSMIVWVLIAGFLLWLGAVGIGLDSCVPERGRDGPPVAGHAAAWLRATPTAWRR